MAKKYLYFLLIIIVVGFICFSLGQKSGEFSERKIAQIELAEKETEIQALQTSLEMFYPPLPEEIYSISGKVTKIEGNKISLDSSVMVSRFPLPEGKEIEQRIFSVIVNDQTKISKIEFFLPEEQPEILSLSDIKVGDEISVNSEEDIKDKEEFVASEIQLMEMGPGL